MDKQVVEEINDDKKIKKRKNSLITIMICSIVIAVDIIIISYPFIYDQMCKNRIYDDLQEKITEDVLSANIRIVTKIVKDSGDAVSTSYSAGFSGVIFYKDNDKYYALTAYHAVENMANIYLVISYRQPTREELADNSGIYISNDEYYGQLPQARVEYFDKKYDLAIVSFETEEELNILEISEVSPIEDEKIVVISNPEGKAFVQTYGKITSAEPVEFGDEAGKTQHKVLRHNAYEAPGSSGSAVLNEDMKILGINLGGGRDGFGNFKYGLAMPSDKILEFIEDWDINKTE